MKKISKCELGRRRDLWTLGMGAGWIHDDVVRIHNEMIKQRKILEAIAKKVGAETHMDGGSVKDPEDSLTTKREQEHLEHMAASLRERHPGREVTVKDGRVFLEIDHPKETLPYFADEKRGSMNILEIDKDKGFYLDLDKVVGCKWRFYVEEDGYIHLTENPSKSQMETQTKWNNFRDMDMLSVYLQGVDEKGRATILHFERGLGAQKIVDAFSSPSPEDTTDDQEVI